MKTLLLLLLATGSRASTITTVAGKVSPASNASNVIAGVAGQDIAPSKVTATSSVTASGFFGDGSGLTSVTGTDASRVLKAGDTMTGKLTAPDLAATYGVVAGTMSISTIGNKFTWDNARRWMNVNSAGGNALTFSQHGAAAGGFRYVLDLDDGSTDSLTTLATIDNAGINTAYGIVASTGSFSGSVTASSVTVLGNIQIPDGSSYKNNTYSGTFVRQSNDLTLGANRNILLEGGHVALNTGITASSATFKDPIGGKTTVKPINNGQSVVHDYENGNTAGFGMNAGGAGYCGALFHSGSARATWCNNGGLALGSYAAATNAPTNTLIVDSVGIGNSAPASKLHMSSGTLLLDGTAPLIKIATLGNRQPLFIDGGVETGYVAANITNNAGAVYLGVDNSVGSAFSAGAYGSFFGSGSAKPACIMTDSVCRLNVAQTTGNVGILTASPVTTLDVNGNAQFGSGATKSTFTATGSLNVAAALSVSGSTFTVATNGNVGIGTSVPTYRLEVAGASGASGLARIGSIDYGSGSVLSVSPGVVSFDAAGTAGGRLRIDSSGNVGIGAPSPTYRLEVAGSAGTSGFSRIGSADYGSGIVLSVSPGVVNFDGPGVVGGRLKIDSSGNVGLGTNAPAQKLDVQGGIGFFPQTRAELEARTPGSAGEAYFCSNCLNGVNMVISTGTTLSGFDSMGVGGTAWH